MSWSELLWNLSIAVLSGIVVVSAAVLVVSKAIELWEDEDHGQD